MKVCDMMRALKLRCLTGNIGLDNHIACGYIGDLLSWVMARAQSECVWITVQGHVNIIAVAILREISAIIFCEGATPTEETIQKALNEGIPLFCSDKNSYELAVLLNKYLERS